MTSGSVRAAALGMILVALPTAGTAQGRGEEAPGQATGTVSAFVAAWGREDLASMEALLAPTVHFVLEGEDRLGVTPRQVSASLEPLFRRFDAVPPQITRQGDLRDPSGRAFAELRWAPTTSGAQPSSRLLFLGLRRLPEGWRIHELRILD